MKRSTQFILWVFYLAVFSALGACGRKPEKNPPPATVSAPSLALFAGDMGGTGTADGVRAAARFMGPFGVATDGAGNVYGADTNNNTIRKITSAGTVTTLAGTAGVIGGSDATGAAASFSGPSGVATDSAGNVYVADTNNHTIRKITPAGVVTTLAGAAGFFGSTDDTGAAARFNTPGSVATDGAGNVYVADFNNNTIRQITPGGVVTTLAGTAGAPSGSTDDIGAAASFNGPFGVATDGIGNVYVADSNNNTIRKIVISTRAVSTFAGTAGVTGSADLTGAAASFNGPFGVATDSAGYVYVAEIGNNTIRKITPAGVVTTLAGTAGVGGSTDATGPAASFSSPFGVACDSAGNVYVADEGNSTIRKITPVGVVTTFAGAVGLIGSTDATAGAASFYGPAGVVTDSSGNVYVADSSNHTIRKITSAGVVTTFAGTAGSFGSDNATGAAARFNFPTDIAKDSAGNMYVADTLNNTIRKITPAGVVTTLAGTAGNSGSNDATGANASFNGPRGVATDGAGNVYVADFTNKTIRKITPLGVVTTLAGMAGVGGGDDAIGINARFTGPVGVATDSTGNLYVGDQGNNTIRKIVIATGAVSTLAGTAGEFGSTNATGAAARFDGPSGVAVNSAGDVYVADTGNNTIRKITPAGVVSTLVGVAGQQGFAPGALPGVLGGPSNVAVSGTSLYITLYNGVAVVRDLK